MTTTLTPEEIAKRQQRRLAEMSTYGKFNAPKPGRVSVGIDKRK